MPMTQYDFRLQRLIASATQLTIASKQSAEESLVVVQEGQKLIEQSRLLLERCRQRYP